MLLKINELINEKLPDQMCGISSGAAIWYFYFRPQIKSESRDKERAPALCPEDKEKAEMVGQLCAGSFSSSAFALR